MKRVMKRLGPLLYFDLLIILVVIRPFFWMIFRGYEAGRVVDRGLIVVMTLLFLVFLLKKDKTHSPKMSAFDWKLWRWTQNGFYLFWIAYVLIGYFIEVPVRMSVPTVMWLVFFVLFNLGAVCYLGLQGYFLKTKKW